MGHGKHHIPIRSVLEAHELGSDRIPAPGCLPSLRRMHNGHGDLLGADRVHFLTQYGLDLLPDSLAERQKAIDAGRKGLDVRGARQKLMARDVGVSRVLSERLSKELCSSHHLSFPGAIVDTSFNKGEHDEGTGKKKNTKQ